MRRIKNSDFVLTLPDEVAGLELGANDSVSLRVYTINADNYYQFDYAGGLVPEEQKVDASCMVTMESGVIQMLVIAHIADNTMPDGYLDITEEVPTDYYWIKSQNESVQEQINQLRKDLEDEMEVREAADDVIEASIDALEDDIDTLDTELHELSGAVESNTTAIEDINLQLDNFNDWQERQDAAIDEISGNVGTNTTAIANERTARENADISLGASITAETYQRQQADTALSGAITQEAAQRNAAIQALEATHNEDIEYLGNTKLDIADFEAYTGSTDTDIEDLKNKETALSGEVQTAKTQIQNLDVKKMDVSGMTDYATKQYTDTGLATKQNTLIAGSGITIDANNVISSTASFDPSVLDDYATKQYVNDAVDAIDLSDYQPVSAMTDYATLNYADAISAYTEDIADTLDQATEVTARSLNELRNTKLDASAYTPFDPSVLADYQPTSAMTGYATTGQVDTLATEVSGKLDATAYTPFDPSVLANYQPVSAMTDYATKTYTDIGLATKQDVLSAGTGIVISDNVISAQADMSNFYTKAEVDNAEQATSAALNDLNLRIIELNTTINNILAMLQNNSN